jgi:phosphoribosyl-ATP pyrophosphohydrolase
MAKKKKPKKAQRPSIVTIDEHTLDRLYLVIEQIAKKLGEEAVEALIEGIQGDKPKLIAESADLLYHLLTLWAACGVKPKAVWDELARREGLSGIAEKASRRRT